MFAPAGSLADFLMRSFLIDMTVNKTLLVRCCRSCRSMFAHAVHFFDQTISGLGQRRDTERDGGMKRWRERVGERERDRVRE